MAVDFILLFDAEADAVQRREVCRLANYCRETILRDGPIPHSVIMGAMALEWLLNLEFSRRNSLCTISVPQERMYGKVIWDNRGRPCLPSDS